LEQATAYEKHYKSSLPSHQNRATHSDIAYLIFENKKIAI